MNAYWKIEEARRKSRQSATSVALSAVCLKGKFYESNSQRAGTPGRIVERCLEHCRDHMVWPDHIVVSNRYMGPHEAPLFRDFAVRKGVQQ
jgi:hypothetical protein